MKAGSTPQEPGSSRVPLVALLVGGQSRRFGSDKALAEIEGRSFQELILEEADQAGLPIVLVGGPEERAAALGRRHTSDLPDARPGPTAGLAAALTVAASEGHPGVVLLACDQPGVTAALLRSVCQLAVAHPRAPMALEGSTGLEPFPAYYPIGALPVALEAKSLRDVLGSSKPPVRIATLDHKDGWATWALDNINTPDDLARHLAKRSSEPS